jgi:hypothetical protein
MNSVARNIYDLTSKEYISKTEAIAIHRTHHFTLDKLIKAGKIELFLINGRVWMKADEVAREIEYLRAQRPIRRPDLFA